MNITESVEYKNALARMKMLSGKGGRPVPADDIVQMSGLSAAEVKKIKH
ncbi:hypothetical protein [uncultured Prevotella sp.]|nr:hypothetical protein [uncultured Prevotella sp.]